MVTSYPQHEDACTNCKFFVKAPPDPKGRFATQKGDCRRNPVTVGKMPGDWCGEYRWKEPKAA